MIRRFLGALLAAALAAMALVLAIATGTETWWLEAPAHARVLRMSGLVAAGAGVYFGTLWLLGFRLRDFSRRVA